MTKIKTDRELIQEKNYNELYQRYLPKIYKESFKLHRNDQMDFVQEAFISVVTAVDRADLSRKFNSFNTILHFYMKGLVSKFLKKEFKENNQISFEESVDEDYEEDYSLNIYAKICKSDNNSLNIYSPENLSVKDQEKVLLDKYNVFMNSLPETHRNYLALKESGFSRKEIAEQINKRVGQLSLISHEIKAVACEVFGINYNNHRNPVKARRVMESVCN